MKDLTVSVVVCFYGNYDPANIIAHIEQQDYPFSDMELIVVDNHIKPLVCKRSGEKDLQVRYVHEPRVGLNNARNAGIAASSAKYILFTDHDSEPSSSWVPEMSSAMEETQAVLVGGRTLPKVQAGATRPGRALMAFFNPKEWPSERTELESPYWIIGCNLGIRRESGLEFDPRLGVSGDRKYSCEEFELAISARRLGAVVVAPRAVVQRAVNSEDLLPMNLWRRAWNHGQSVVILHSIHPEFAMRDPASAGAVGEVRNVLEDPRFMFVLIGRGLGLRWRMIREAIVK